MTAENPTPEAPMPNVLTDAQRAEMQAAFGRMTAQARRELKKMSKNELVRTVISQLIDIHQMRQALKEANEALEMPAGPAIMEKPSA